MWPRGARRYSIASNFKGLGGGGTGWKTGVGHAAEYQALTGILTGPEQGCPRVNLRITGLEFPWFAFTQVICHGWLSKAVHKLTLRVAQTRIHRIKFPRVFGCKIINWFTVIWPQSHCRPLSIQSIQGPSHHPALPLIITHMPHCFIVVPYPFVVVPSPFVIVPWHLIFIFVPLHFLLIPFLFSLVFHTCYRK